MTNEWWLAPETIKQAWRTWIRQHERCKRFYGPRLSSDAFAAGWLMRWTDEDTRRELERLKQENATLREQIGVGGGNG